MYLILSYNSQVVFLEPISFKEILLKIEIHSGELDNKD